MLKHFFPILQPPLLSNLLKSTCSTCSAFKIFQNIQNCNRHQSAQDAQAPKVFFSRVFISGFWHSVQTCLRNSLYGFLWPHVALSDCVVWSGFCGFFFQIDFVNMFQKKIKEFQIFFPISAKVMPWSLWKLMWPQCIFEGKHFPNSIGFSPGKAQVTNIDLKCSFFTGLQKVKAGSQFFSNCAWGFHEDGYWNQPW